MIQGNDVNESHFSQYVQFWYFMAFFSVKLDKESFEEKIYDKLKAQKSLK